MRDSLDSPLGAQIEKALEPTDVHERDDVRPVHDDRNPGCSRCQAPEDARLARMRMNNICSSPPEGPRERTKRRRVRERRDRAHQTRQRNDAHTRIDLLEDLWPSLSTVDEDHIVATFRRVVAGEHGVFVSSPVDQARDHVHDLQRA